MTKNLSRVNLALRALMEAGIILGFACWGYRSGATPVISILLAIVVPVSLFAFWGFVDFPQTGVQRSFVLFRN
jgi:hypothetical protein